MKRLYTLFVSLTLMLHASAQSPLDTLGAIRYFTLTDGQLMAIPERYILDRAETAKHITLTLQGDTAVTIARNRLASESTEFHATQPEMTSFKFNNKFNPQLATDAIGTIDTETGRIDVDVACIGKRLTPSFQLSDGASAYIDGIRQHSKKTRRRFDQPTSYTVAYPKNWLYLPRKVSDEVWSQPEEQDPDQQWLITPVPLTADMLSTNAPSNYGEDPAMLLDGDVYTFFHSTWGSGEHQKLFWYEGCSYDDGFSEWPYLEIELPEPLHTFTFSYTTRAESGYAPTAFMLQGSNDGIAWEEIKTFKDDQDALPYGRAASYTSPILTNGHPYTRLRLQLMAALKKNYLVLSEFSLSKAEPNPAQGEGFAPELLLPAEYKWGFVPLGRTYDVHVRYLTDHSTAQYRVPTIHINTFDGTMITSKNYYWDASFELDGAGIYENIKVDTMQIKGRGNTSWVGGSYSKNPFRLKFPEKIKPFGLTKGKNWVLLANRQTGSMTTNAIAMYLADMVQTKGCNHIIPVELYINGFYFGSYNFTEKVGFANNSIDLADESKAVLLELDSYYDETYKFRDPAYRLYTNIKEPEFDNPESTTLLTYNDVVNAFSDFTYNLKIAGGDLYTRQLDVDAFCRAMLVTDLTRNQECKHPKSWFLYNEDITADSLWTFGPVWDFDWAFGYDGTRQYFVHNADTDLFSGMSSYSDVGYPFFHDLLNNSDVVKKHYYRLWTEFVQSDGVGELLEFCDDYYDFANPSFQHNATWWSDGKNYDTHTDNAKNWLAKRANHIYQNLTPYDLGDDLIELPEEEFGQPDRVDVGTVLGKPVDVYTLKGIRIRHAVPCNRLSDGLMPGIYIVEGKKFVVK